MLDQRHHHGAPKRRLSPRERRERRLPWTRPLRRLRRAIDCSLRLIDGSRKVAEASERRGRTSRELCRASGWLARAAERLDRAAFDLGQTNLAILDAPERAGGVRAVILDETQRWLEAAQHLSSVSEQLDELAARLFGSGDGFTVPSVRAVDGRPRIVTAPRLVWARPFLRLRRSRMRERLLSVIARRRRLRPMRPADAPRRISRGRAPPFGSTV